MSSQFGSLKSRVLMTSSAAVLGLALTSSFGSVAYAQDADAGAAPAQEIVVTGSRIVRRDYSSNSPIVTLNSEVFENSSSGAIETNLNKLPQFTPAIQGQFTSLDVQNTVVNTPGSANVSLRGLGPGRNLVLVDGRRAMPSNGAMLVDINTIPSAMIDRVEIITGGASAVYGADAISGVANFILKKDYQGITVDTQYGMTQLDDGEEFRISGLIGGNFADDRGNATLALEHFTRGKALQRDRSFYTKGWTNPNVPGTDFWPVDTYFNPAPFGVCFLGACPTQAAVDAIFTVPAPGAVAAGSLFMVNQSDGTLYTGMPQFGGNGADELDGAYRYNGGFDLRVQPRNGNPGVLNQAFKVNEPEARITAPLTRYSAFARSHYDITDWLTGFLEANLTQTRTTTFLQYSPAVNAWGVLIPHGDTPYAGSWVDTDADGVPDAGEPFAPGYGPGGAFGLNCTALAATAGCTTSEVFPTPAELQALLDSRVAPGFGPDLIPFTLDDPGPASGRELPWHMSRNLNFLPQRQTDNTNTTWQVTAGFEGTIANTDWTWTVFASHGRSEQRTLNIGFASLEGYRAIALSPNYGRGATITGNSDPSTNPGNAGFAAGSVSCTSGLPIFGTGSITQDCIDAITAPLIQVSAMEQDIVEADIQGGLFDNWAGNVRYALGASYRSNEFQFFQDNLNSQNNALNSAIGLFPSNSTKGFVDVSEVYGELLIPILSDLPFIKAFNVEAGWRYSDYNTAGGVETYKILGDYSMNDWLRIRGGYNRATRAPNIGELFQAKAQTVAFATFADPCTLNGDPQTTPGGTNPTWGPDSASAAQAAAALAICTALMGPGAAAYYASIPAQPVNTGFSLALPNNVGNPNLDPETAKTYTLGIVLRSPFEHPLISRTTLSVDWYSIELTGLITAESQDQVYQNCLDVTRNTTSSPTIPACLAIIRDQKNGAVQTVNTSFVNAGGFETRGIDMQLDWAADLADFPLVDLPGTLTLNVIGNYVDTLSVAPSRTAPSVEFVDTTGPNTGGLNAPAFRYRLTTNVGYSLGPTRVSVQWRHLPGTGPTPPANTFQRGPEAYNIFDLSVNHTLNDNISLRGGVDNLIDVDPQVTAANLTPTVGVFSPGSGVTLPAIYDVLGRRFYLGVKVSY